MATWDEVSAAERELAAKVRARFDAHRHKVLATLRQDGSPRPSGVEATFHDGGLWLGMMPGSLKARDPVGDSGAGPPCSNSAFGKLRAATPPLRPRTIQPRRDVGFLGELLPCSDRTWRRSLRRLAMSLVRIGDPPDHLVIESWQEGRGSKRVERA